MCRGFLILPCCFSHNSNQKPWGAALKISQQFKDKKYNKLFNSIWTNPHDKASDIAVVAPTTFSITSTKTKKEHAQGLSEEYYKPESQERKSKNDIFSQFTKK